MNSAAPISKRSFLQGGTLLMAGAALGAQRLLAADNQAKSALRVGLMTDMHYADKDPRGTRHYRETLDKLAEAADKLNDVKPDFVVELGDFVDAADAVDVEKGYLATVTKAFAAIKCDRHFVLGNHCVDTLTKDEFLEGVEQENAHYSFDAGGWHFVVVDSCYRKDGKPYGRKNSVWTDANLPEEELEWLAADLKAAGKTPTILFAHQRLDVAGKHSVRNAAAARKIIAAAGNVQAVFQGHSHANEVQLIDGTQYCTLHAMVEGDCADNNGYSTMDLFADGSIRIQGFRKQANYDWQG